MSLAVSFHRAANAELIEASAWYEGKRLGLAAEFVAEIERCVSLASEHPEQFPLVQDGIRRSSPIVFLTAFIFVPRKNALLF